MFFLIRKLLGKRKKKPAGEKPIEPPRSVASRKPRPEWEKTLVASLEVNNLAPSEEVILHAFDLYKDELFGPIEERRLQLTDLYSEILAEIAALKALAPDLVERAMARHPFEFSHIIEHKET
jgi:hypothetical protein